MTDRPPSAALRARQAFPVPQAPLARSSRALPLVVLLAALGLAACDGGDGANGAETETSAAGALSAEARTAIERGREHARAGRYALALEEYRTVSGVSHPELQLAMGESLAGLGRLGEAQAVLSSAAASAPDDADVALQLGIVYRRMLSLELAARELRRSIALEPDGALAHLELGRALVERATLFEVDQARLDEAIAAFERAVELAPDATQPRYRAALAYETKGRPDEAIEHLEVLVRSSPEHVDGRRMLGLLLVARGDVERGREEIEAAREVAPEDADTIYASGVALEAQGDTERAREEYERAIELKPQLHDALRRLAEIHRAAGETDAARNRQAASEAWARKDADLGSKRLAAMAAPDDVLKQYEFGLALLEMGREPEAEAVFRRCIEIHPTLPGPHYCLGRIAEKYGHLEAARDLYETVVRLSTEDPAGHPELLRIYNRLGDLASARRVSEELITLYPEELRYRLELANIHLRENDPGGARAVVEATLATDPDYADGYVKLGSVALVEGTTAAAEGRMEDAEERMAEAELHWRRALELDPDATKAQFLLDGLPRIRASLRGEQGRDG